MMVSLETLKERAEVFEGIYGPEDAKKVWDFLDGIEVYMKSGKCQEIKVWPYKDAPPAYKELSTHGGDEDWVAYVPPQTETPSWIDQLGVCSVSEHHFEDGSTVYIGAHA